MLQTCICNFSTILQKFIFVISKTRAADCSATTAGHVGGDGKGLMDSELMHLVYRQRWMLELTRFGSNSEREMLKSTDCRE